MLKRLLVAFATIVALLSTRTAVHAQDHELGLIEEPDEGRRLEGWLASHAENGSEQRTAILTSTIGVAAVAFGAYNVFNERTETLDDSVGWILVGVGSLVVAGGIRDWVNSERAPDRYARWRRATQSGITERLIGEFSAELRDDARAAYNARFALRMAGLSLSIASSTLLVLNAAGVGPESERDHRYLLSGCGAGIGLVWTLISFIRSVSEVEWESYQEGYRPELASDSGPTLDVTPTVSPSALGLSLSGTF